MNKLMRLKSYLPYRFLTVVFATLLLFTQGASAASDRYLVEQNLTHIAQNGLNAIFGENNFVVRVSVLMTDSKYSVKYTNESNPKKNSKDKEKDKVYILPGVPALQNIAPNALNQFPYDSVTTMVEPKIKRIHCYILANKNYPRTKARKAEALVKEILKMKDGRDTVKMDFKPFYEDPNKETQNITIVPGKEPLLTVQNGFFLLISLLLIIFLFLYLYYQKKLIATQVTESTGPSINVNPNLELPEGAGGGGGPGSGNINVNMNANIKVYFDFVTDANINDFIYLLQSQKLKPEYLSLIVSFLPRHLAAKVVKELSPKLQAQVTLSVSSQQLGSRVLLDKLEKKLKSDLECFVGGTDKVSNAISLLSNEERQSVVEQIKTTDAKGFKVIRPLVVLFSDLQLLEESELQLILSEVNLEQLATALINVDQELFELIQENLTKGAKDMVNQYLELKTDSTNSKDIEKAQDAIINLTKKMDRSGKIDLSTKLQNL